MFAVAHTNEFQKRGLPHSHILAWQVETGSELSASEVDKYISAELPDPKVDPLGSVANLGFQRGYATKKNSTCNSVQSIYNLVIKFKFS